MNQLTTKEKDLAREKLEDKIGTTFDRGVTSQVLNSVNFRDYNDEDGSGTVTHLVIETSRLDVSGLQDIGLKILAVEREDVESFRGGFRVQVGGSSLKDLIE